MIVGGSLRQGVVECADCSRVFSTGSTRMGVPPRPLIAGLAVAVLAAVAGTVLLAGFLYRAYASRLGDYSF